MKFGTMSGYLSATKRTALIGCMLLATACGVTYFSPSVEETVEGAPVTVVTLDSKRADVANAVPYRPRELPSVFFSAAGYGSGATGLGALPSQPYLPDESHRALEYRPLPNLQKQPYRIGVGDVVLLATSGGGSTIEQLSGLLAAQNSRQGYSVRDDGTITIPSIGPIRLVGLTLQEAENELFQVLVNNQIDPSFSIEVAEFNSQRVTIGGAVGIPKIVPVTLQGLTLGEALAVSGGIQVKDEQFASIRVYREGSLYQIPVSTYRETANMQNALLQNGDAVFVDTSYDLDRALEFYRAQLSVISLRNSARGTALASLQTEINIQRGALSERREIFQLREQLGAEKRDYVYLTGEVNKQSRFPLPYNNQATLADVLFGEGGFDTTTGNPSEIYVLRADDPSGGVDRITAYHLNARNAAAFVIATKMEMRPNDIIFIEEQPITKWGRALQQLFPTILQAAGSSI